MGMSRLRAMGLAALVLAFAAVSARATVSGKWEKMEDCVLADGYMDGDSFHIRYNNKDIIIRLFRFISYAHTTAQIDKFNMGAGFLLQFYCHFKKNAG